MVAALDPEALRSPLWGWWRAARMYIQALALCLAFRHAGKLPYLSVLFALALPEAYLPYACFRGLA